MIISFLPLSMTAEESRRTSEKRCDSSEGDKHRHDRTSAIRGKGDENLGEETKQGVLGEGNTIKVG